MSKPRWKLTPEQEAAWRATVARIGDFEGNMARAIPEAFREGDNLHDGTFWMRTWAFARMQLGLTEEEFWSRTPSEIVALAEAKRGPYAAPKAEKKSEPKATIGKRIRAGRAKLGWTQADLAERAGCSIDAVKDIESGRTRKPRAKTLTEIAVALALDLSHLH